MVLASPGLLLTPHGTGVEDVAHGSMDIIVAAWVVGLTHATELGVLIQQLVMRLAPDGKLILGEH